MKKLVKFSSILVVMAFCFTMFTVAPSAAAKKIVIGFAQGGAESGWRTAETDSIKAEAKRLGKTVTLKFTDANGKQENQIKSIRTFIQQKVDVIGLSPLVTTGWDAVFKEAKAKKIPIILLDRGVDKSLSALYATFIGSDFVLEGKNAAIAMAKVLGEKGNVFELEGGVGADPAILRKKGFDDEMAKNHKNIKIVKSQTGEWTRAKGQEVMESWLKSDKGNINGLYAHNDDMALGAIEAIKAAGLKPSVDIKVVSIDGVKAAFQALIKGETNAVIECNPLLGPQFFKAAIDLKAGKKISKWIKSDEGIYTTETPKSKLPKGF